LHLLGAVNQSHQATSKSLLALLISFYQGEFDQLKRPEVQTSPLKPDAPQLQRVEQIDTPDNKAHEQGEVLEYQQNFERLFKSLLGTLVHQYYEYGLFEPSAENVVARLIEIGTSPSDLDEWVAFVLRLLSNTKQDPQFNWLFKDRSSTLTEAEFATHEHTIVIDRMFIDDNILWIIDFKTAEPVQGEPLTQFISRQQSQHAKQLLFYKETLNEIYDNDIKCALYCPVVSQLIEIKH
jgi:ATP-dependent exoDNAse (exonuclease V) beta subunit